MSAYFRFFKESSEEERVHAEKLMEYQVNSFFLLSFLPSLVSSILSFWFVMIETESGAVRTSVEEE